MATLYEIIAIVETDDLVIPHKSARICEQVCWTNAHRSFAALRMTAEGLCHPERSEGSIADLWAITRSSVSTIALISYKIARHCTVES